MVKFHNRQYSLDERGEVNEEIIYDKENGVNGRLWHKI